MKKYVLTTLLAGAVALSMSAFAPVTLAADDANQNAATSNTQPADQSPDQNGANADSQTSDQNQTGANDDTDTD